MNIVEMLLNSSSRITGAKIGKKIEDDQKRKIVEILAQKIELVGIKKNKQEIINMLNENDIKYLINQTGRFGQCPCGAYHPFTKNLYIREDNVEYMYETGESDNTVVHEAIHKLQDISLLYKGKEIRGFIEGATEYYALKTDTLGKRGAIIIDGNTRYNLPLSPYIENVSIMAQLGIVFGEERLEDFAFGDNKTLLKEIKSQYGSDFYEMMRRGLNSLIKAENTSQLLDELQTLILDRCYQEKYKQIESIDDAIAFFKELKRIDYVRGHIEGNNYFRKFYEQKYSECTLKFQEDIDKLKEFEYKEPTFLKVQSWGEIKEDLHYLVLSSVCTSNILQDNILGRDKYTRYAVLKDGRLHHLLLRDGKPVSYNIASEMDGNISTRMDINDDIKEFKVNIIVTSGEIESTYIIVQSDDGIVLKDGDQEIKFRAVELGITDEDIRNETELNQTETRKYMTLRQRKNNLFARSKIPLLDAISRDKTRTEFLSDLKVEIDNSKTISNDTEGILANSKSLNNIDDIIAEI